MLAMSAYHVIVLPAVLVDQIPPHALARVTSFDFLASAGVVPLGLALAGPVLAAAGLTATFVGETAIGVALALVALATPATRGLRRSAA